MRGGVFQCSTVENIANQNCGKNIAGAREPDVNQIKTDCKILICLMIIPNYTVLPIY